MSDNDSDTFEVIAEKSFFIDHEPVVKEKKKNKNSSLPGGGTTSGSKVSGSQTGGPAARFQRKSGPSGSAG